MDSSPFSSPSEQEDDDSGHSKKRHRSGSTGRSELKKNSKDKDKDNKKSKVKKSSKNKRDKKVGGQNFLLRFSIQVMSAIVFNAILFSFRKKDSKLTDYFFLIIFMLLEKAISRQCL